MIKRMVFLYHTQKNKEDLLQYERVMRALLRKFRKSPLFSYLQIDTSLPCRDRMCELIQNEVSRRGAIFIESDAQSIPASMNLLESALGIQASAHFVSGRAICYAEQSCVADISESTVSYTNTFKKEDVKKATSIAIETAKKRKRSLSICLNGSNALDHAFLCEAETVLSKEKHIKSEFISLDEMILLCLKTVPEFDVVLTMKDYASFISMHLNPMPETPSGYIVSYGEKRRVYRRQILPNEETGNLHHLSSLLSLAAVFENEFEMKSAADWFRRAISLAFLKSASDSFENFISEVIKEIKMPIRKRRTE